MRCLNQKSTVQSVASCILFTINIVIVIDSAHLKLFFFDAISPLATKMGRIISKLQFYV